ncbi:MAG TPA: hypothetical protein VGN75_18695 [Kaistia sp.]|jgi:hypothetical protein|nr:hypothetical protein [Kaistia sp.]
MVEITPATPDDPVRNAETSAVDAAQAARRFVAMPLEVYNAVSEFIGRQPFGQVEGLVSLLRKHAQVVEAATPRDGAGA